MLNGVDLRLARRCRRGLMPYQPKLLLSALGKTRARLANKNMTKSLVLFSFLEHYPAQTRKEKGPR